MAARQINKSKLDPQKQRKLAEELQFQRLLNHPNIVSYEHFFEDAENVYVLLELCQNLSLATLMHKRGCLSPVEARYFLG